MAQRIVNVAGIGEVLLAKRRGATHIRLSITPAGKVRVGLPQWTPYAVGIAFARTRADWINQHLNAHQADDLKSEALIGKSHRLYYKHNPSRTATTARITPTSINVVSNLDLDNPKVQAKVKLAAEKALKAEALNLLPTRLDQLAKKHGFSYSTVNIRKLTSRWGSCSTNKTISLSYYLMQLPWRLIDYVLVHELVHTEHLNHGKDFWARFNQVMPEAKKVQKELRAYKPKIKPAS